MKIIGKGILPLARPNANVISSGDCGLVTFRVDELLPDLDTTRYLEFSGELYKVRHWSHVEDAGDGQYSIINAQRVSGPAANSLL
jgi:hypothetical protein